METRPQARVRSGPSPVLVAWLLAVAILLLSGWHGIVGREFPDPDDALRLQQVRDWMAGQSWFDVTQYRLNPPDGAPMHWSRLVDVPIAAVILLLRPLLGAAGAEMAALVIVPLAILALVMTLVARLTERLLDRQHAFLATLLVPVSIPVIAQLRPLRIDHHGWQIALALAAVLAAMDRDRKRSGLVAGSAAALWLHISLEGLPLAAALGALFALRWLIEGSERERLAWFAGALAGGSLLLYLATHAPATWLAIHCDAVSPGYLAMLGIGAIGVMAAGLLREPAWPLRLFACAAIGTACIAALALVAPQCAAGGPFAELDPLVRRFWYEQVPEGLPIWRQTVSLAAVVIAFPLVGIYGSWRALDASHGQRRYDWCVLLFMLVCATLAAVMVQRAGAVANLLALPGGVFLLEAALTRARTTQRVAARIAITAAALLLVIPAYPVIAIDTAIEKAGPSGGTATLDCVTTSEIGRLDQLPLSDIAAPLDITPSIIVNTRQRAIASGHHRNNAAMRDVILIFTSPPDQARRLLAARGADYVAVCPRLIEPKLYREYNPNGLWAELEKGRTPPWLEPVRLEGASYLRVWRIKPSI